MSPEKRSELSRLVNECVATFFCSEAGARQLHFYAAAAEQARRNYRKIQRSTDPEAILLKLLPHHNTSENRRRGAWIHPAPAIARDIKSSFEFGRWTPTEDRAAVSAAIMGLIEECLDRPDDLARVCQEFSTLPAVNRCRVGLLTPILNALAPEHFLLVNSTVQLVINDFMGTNYDAGMAAYPELNRAGWQLIEAVKPALEGLSAEDVPLSMLFSAFCHWLVVRRKYLEGGHWKLALAGADRQWDGWRENGYVAIAWDALGDLSGLSQREFEHRRDRVIAEHAEGPGWSPRALNQVWRFVRIKPGDRVVMTHGKTRLLGVGTVTGPYYFVRERATDTGCLYSGTT